MPNKGEWSEPYAALKILGEGKLYIADENGQRNPNEWMSIIELIRHETSERIVTYRYQEENVDIDILVNGRLIVTVPAQEFLQMADELAYEIRTGRKASFDVSENIQKFLYRIELRNIKADSINKSDVFLSVRDPRAGVVRNHIGFSIKSSFGKDPTLFNTAKASGFIYHLQNVTDDEMEAVNSIFDKKNHAAVSERCDLIKEFCNPTFYGLPVAARARCKAFEENLDLIDTRLVSIIERILWNHFFEHETETDLPILVEKLINENPCGLTRPEVKYPYILKSFIFAAYCGMTASTLWDGRSEVNGGFIKVSEDGEVLAYYALESDAFKTYLLNNCYFEFPSTDSGHGDYGYIYKVNGEYYFNLNFQIRYR